MCDKRNRIAIACYRAFNRVKPSFVNLTSGHSDAQPWASECPDVKKYKWPLNPVWHRMLYSCTHTATVGIKGLNVVWNWIARLCVWLMSDKVCCCCHAVLPLDDRCSQCCIMHRPPRPGAGWTSTSDLSRKLAAPRRGARPYIWASDYPAQWSVTLPVV